MKKKFFFKPTEKLKEEFKEHLLAFGYRLLTSHLNISLSLCLYQYNTALQAEPKESCRQSDLILRYSSVQLSKKGFLPHAAIVHLKKKNLHKIKPHLICSSSPQISPVFPQASFGVDLLLDQDVLEVHTLAGLGRVSGIAQSSHCL